MKYALAERSADFRRHRRRGDWLLQIAVACLGLGLATANRATPSAEEILRRAEDVRSPDLTFAVDIKIHAVATNGKLPTREAMYAMVARGKDHAIILMLTPKALYGGLLLIADEQYWLLFPGASSPFQIAAVQIVQGELAAGDIARANLTRNYDPTFQTEEAIDGKPCYRLELVPAHAPAPYTRILYWIAKKGFLPEKLEYYGQTSRLLRSVRYHDYVKGPLGLRPMRLEIETAQQWEDRSTLIFSNLRQIDATVVPFTPAGMIQFRDSAMARMESDGREPRIEDILPMLRR